jgi:hypothetical protein
MQGISKILMGIGRLGLVSREVRLGAVPEAEHTEKMDIQKRTLNLDIQMKTVQEGMNTHTIGPDPKAVARLLTRSVVHREPLNQEIHQHREVQMFLLPRKDDE